MSNMYGGLDSYNQFILYKKIWDAGKGKWNKIPCSMSGEAIDAHDISFHVGRDEAILAAQLLGDDYGPAFVFSKNDPFFFLDIDGAFRDGQWSELSRQLRALFPGAYVEASLSNTGLHIVGSYTGDIEHKCKNIPLNIELYTESRFMALGTAYHGDVSTESTVGLVKLVEQYFNPTATKTDDGESIEWTDKPEPGCRPIPNDDALIQKAMLSASASQVFGGNTATFAQLWNADAEALSACYPNDDGNGYDASSADAALATHLIFWTGGDCERVSRLMRKSSLVRDKWDRRGDDYLKRTILGSKRARGSSDYYRMTDEVIEFIEPCDDAIQLADDIKKAIELSINSELQKVADQKPFVLTVYPEAVDQIITRSFWSGTKSKLFIMTGENTLNMYREQDMIRISEKYFGQMWDKQELDYATSLLRELTIIDSTSAEREFLKRINTVGIGIITDHLKMYNQRDKLSSTVDMFANRPRMEWTNDSVKNVYVWKPLPNFGEINKEVVEDYKNHFPMCDLLIRQIVASRFASDRKKCFTWLKADSDWGKGILTSALEDLGLLVELSVTETEKAFEGAPMAKDASLFTHAFVVCFNEFKVVKSELKQIENKLPVSPKNQLMQMVDIYHKLFTSAESVDSLVGEYGVEMQFANRFTYIEGKGEINIRPVFNRIGKFNYFKSVKAYIARLINEEVDKYIAMGKEQATITSDEVVENFHRNYGIDQAFDRVAKNVPEIIESFKDWLIQNHYAPFPGAESFLYHDDQFYYVKSPSKVFNDWLDDTAPRSEKMTLLKRKNDILETMSGGGKITGHRVNGKLVRSLKFPK